MFAAFGNSTEYILESLTKSKPLQIDNNSPWNQTEELFYRLITVNDQFITRQSEIMFMTISCLSNLSSGNPY